MRCPHCPHCAEIAAGRPVRQRARDEAVLTTMRAHVADNGGMARLSTLDHILRKDRSTIRRYANMLVESGDYTLAREFSGRRGKPPIVLVSNAHHPVLPRNYLSEDDYILSRA